MKSPWLSHRILPFYAGLLIWAFLLAPHAHASGSHDPTWDIRLGDLVGDGIRWLGGKIQDWMGG